MRLLRRVLEHPLTRGMDIDDPCTTDLRNEIIRSKPILRNIYEEWYRFIISHLPDVSGPVLELGSGAGFLSQRIDSLITSEIFVCRNVRVLLDGQWLPFRDESLRAIAMTNVLHHIPRPEVFLREAYRCLRPRGRVLMIEPWVTGWSKIVYTRLHHEPFNTKQNDWSHDFGGPLSGANGALPWIIFQRDRQLFEKQFPELQITEVQPLMPLQYLFSGGVSMRQLLPSFLHPVLVSLERRLRPWMEHCAMFAFVALSRPAESARVCR